MHRNIFLENLYPKTIYYVWGFRGNSAPSPNQPGVQGMLRVEGNYFYSVNMFILI